MGERNVHNIDRHSPAKMSLSAIEKHLKLNFDSKIRVLHVLSWLRELRRHVHERKQVNLNRYLPKSS